MCVHGSTSFLCTKVLRYPDTRQRNAQRADQALNADIPRLKDELEESLVVLQDLSVTLPRIRSRVANIRYAYDSGRMKVSFYSVARRIVLNDGLLD